MMKHFFFLSIWVNISSLFLPNKELYEMTDEEFMAQSSVNQPIDAKNPNEDLLDAALFHATNEQRIKHNLPTFKYHSLIHKTAIGHSNDMIDQDFYNHVNPYTRRKLEDRIFSYTIEFKRVSENIAQYDLIETGERDDFCFLIPKNDNDYIYRDCQTKKPLSMMTYAKFARHVVKGWMNSPPHRKQILEPLNTFMACSAKLSKDAYKSKRCPFARITQDFGGTI
jgi:uncharacterized protein YkwD